MLQAVLIPLFLFALLGALYYYGLISLDVKRCSMFIGSMRGDHARFRRCTGHIRRRLLFRKSCKLTISLQLALTEGDVTVEILDGGRPKARLDAEHPDAVLQIPAGAQYVQIIRLDGASGEYTLKKS